MAKLSDLQLASLLDEIACAMRAGTPIVASMQRLQDRRLGSVARAAGRVADNLSRGKGLAESFESIDSSLSREAAATIQCCQQAGDGGLLERMAAQLRQRSEYARNCRLAWLYPLLLLLIGYAVGVWVMAPLVQRYQGRDFDWPPAALQTAQWLEANWIYPPLVVAALVLILGLWSATSHRLSWPVRMRLFAQSLADQLAHNVPEDLAIRNAANMSGDKSLQSIDNPTLDSPPVKQILAEASLQDIDGVNRQETLVAQLRLVSTLYAQRARRQGYLWSQLVPRTAMMLVGGGMVFAYTWWVIAPVYRQVSQW